MQTEQVGVPETIDNRIRRIVLQCDYDEYTPGSYRGIVLDYGPAVSRFFTGNPYKDRLDAIKEAEEHGYEVMISSSWHNMMTDAVKHFVSPESNGFTPDGSKETGG